jgi:hypothetical protein
MGGPARAAVQTFGTGLMMRKPRRTLCESDCSSFSRSFQLGTLEPRAK